MAVLSAIPHSIANERGGAGRLPLYQANRASTVDCCGTLLFLNAGVRGLPGAFVEAGEYRIIHLLALDQIDHDRRRLVTHLERPLTDQRFDATFLGDREFFADGIR